MGANGRWAATGTAEMARVGNKARARHEKIFAHVRKAEKHKEDDDNPESQRLHIGRLVLGTVATAKLGLRHRYIGRRRRTVAACTLRAIATHHKVVQAVSAASRKIVVPRRLVK